MIYEKTIPATINGEPTQTFPTLQAAIDACVNDGVESVLTRDQIIEYINHNYPNMTDNPPFTQDVELKIQIMDCDSDECNHGDDGMCFTTVIDEDLEEEDSITEYVDGRSENVFRLWPTNNCTNREGGESCIVRMDNAKCNQCLRHLDIISKAEEGDEDEDDEG